MNSTTAAGPARVAQLGMDFDRLDGVAVWADPLRLRQVVNNLLRCCCGPPVPGRVGGRAAVMMVMLRSGYTALG